MNFVLLVGAGFSRNWGGWLSAEAFEYLLGCPGIQRDPELKAALWKHQAKGFEYALAEIQLAHARDSVAYRSRLDVFQSAISQMFADMNSAFLKSRFEFQIRQIEQTVVYLLSKFDAIFTLNQDLLLEHQYLACNLATGPYRNWSGRDLPGLALAPGQMQDPLHHWSLNQWQPKNPVDFAIHDGCQPFIKLHGSSNWIAPSGSPLLVIGGNKSGEIQQHPLLTWYARVFDEHLRREHTRLMIIGYGFGDEHINTAIGAAVQEKGLQIFNVSPEGATQARALNDTRTRGHIIARTDLEDWLEPSLIGGSRRSLSETFGGDTVEHGKLMRFFDF